MQLAMRLLCVILLRGGRLCRSRRGLRSRRGCLDGGLLLSEGVLEVAHIGGEDVRSRCIPVLVAELVVDGDDVLHRQAPGQDGEIW